MIGKERRSRQRGGRHKSGMPRHKPNVVRHHVALDDELWNLLESWRRPDETYNDTLWRVFREINFEKVELRKKVDALLIQTDRAPMEIIQRNDTEIRSQYEL